MKKEAARVETVETSAGLLRVLRGRVSPIADGTLSHILSRPFFSICAIRLRRICMSQRFGGLVPTNFRCLCAATVTRWKVLDDRTSEFESESRYPGAAHVCVMLRFLRDISHICRVITSRRGSWRSLRNHFTSLFDRSHAQGSTVSQIEGTFGSSPLLHGCLMKR